MTGSVKSFNYHLDPSLSLNTEARARLKCVSTLRLTSNATSALKSKMVHNDPKPRSLTVKIGVLFSGAQGK